MALARCPRFASWGAHASALPPSLSCLSRSIRCTSTLITVCTLQRTEKARRERVLRQTVRRSRTINRTCFSRTLIQAHTSAHLYPAPTKLQRCCFVRRLSAQRLRWQARHLPCKVRVTYIRAPILMVLYAVRFASQSLPKTPTPAFPKEYEHSKVTVPIPGPQSKKLFAEMSKHQVRFRVYFFCVRLFPYLIGILTCFLIRSCSSRQPSPNTSSWIMSALAATTLLMQTGTSCWTFSTASALTRSVRRVCVCVFVCSGVRARVRQVLSSCLCGCVLLSSLRACVRVRVFACLCVIFFRLQRACDGGSSEE